MSREFLGTGWDCEAWLVDGEWVERTARRPDVEPWLRTETTLLPWLAPQLPLPVPAPVVVGTRPLTTRHRLVPGTPLVTVPGAVDATELGAVVGTFLRVLHGTDLDEAIVRGLPAPTRTRRMRDEAHVRFRTEVLPRLPARAARSVGARLEQLADAPAEVVVHGDFSADHVLVADGRVTGVIDWGDARSADTAKDLAWPLHLAGPATAAAARAAYGADDALVDRARAWVEAAPCYAVTHGLDTGDEGLVAEGLRQLTALCSDP